MAKKKNLYFYTTFCSFFVLLMTTFFTLLRKKTPPKIIQETCNRIITSIPARPPLLVATRRWLQEGDVLAAVLPSL